MDKLIPEIIVGRLPVYLQALEHMEHQGIQTTSSQELGEVIGISAAQIRKDLSQFGEFGKQGKGYSVVYLVDQLRAILNTHERVEGYDTHAKMNPPHREEADREAIRQALRDGTIDVVASDHAPHHYDAKEREFDDAPNGIIGLDTALSVGLRELVRPGLLTLPELIDRMSTRAARIFHLPGGTLASGAPADLVVYDPEASWLVEPARLHSRSRNTPFAGETLPGVVHLTLVDGAVVYRR